MSVDERVEEVDEEGRVLRIVTRSEMRSARLRHRTTFIAVIDPAGRLLVHQRSDQKDVWPSRWDIAAGGVVGVGESWNEGARRELAEELGLWTEVRALGHGRYDDADVKTVAAVFVSEIDEQDAEHVRFADGEVVAAEWLTSEALDRALTQREFCPDSIALVLPLVRPLLTPR